jgi:hypothetical protein
MWLGELEEAVWLLLESVIVWSPSLSLSDCANRGLMAAKKSPSEPGRSATRKAEICGRPSGGTDFLFARPGWDFSVAIRKAVWRGW